RPGTERRVCDRDTRGALLRQGALARERRPLGGGDREEHLARRALSISRIFIHARILGAVQWPRTIRVGQHTSLTTAEPAIAVARDQVIDLVPDQLWDEVKNPCPPPVRKLARNAQGGFGFNVSPPLRHKGEGIRTLRIDAELLSERTSLGQLDRNETK